MAVRSVIVAAGVDRSTSKLRKLIWATAVTSLGDGLAVVTFSLLAVRLTARPVLVAGVTVMSALPWLLVALPIGVLVDRLPRRSIVVAVESARAVLLILAAIAVAMHSIDLVVLYAIVFFVGVGETATSAICTAVVPSIVSDPGRLPAANGNLQAAETFGQTFAGPAVGGFLYSVASSLPLFGDAFSFIASASLLGKVVPQEASPAREGTQHLVGGVRSGLKWLFANPALRALTAAVGSFAFCQSMVIGVLVVYATRVLHLGARGYGLLLAVAAIGDVLGSFAGKRIHALLGPYRTIVATGLLAAGAYVVLGGVALVTAAGFAMFLESVATTTGQVSISSLRHRLIPTERFGITVNAMRLFTMGLAPVGALVGGGLAETIGTRSSFVAAGALQFALLAAVAVPLRRGISSGLATAIS